MADDPAVLLADAGQEAGHVQEGDQGMLKASHICTNRAAFSLAWMSSTPARVRGWLATIPTTWPSRRASAHTMLRAQCSWTSRYSPSSTISPMTAVMS